jgi:hypothetical protein
VAGFYRGLATSLLGVSHAAVQFPLYEKLKYIFHFQSLTPVPHDFKHREVIQTHHILGASVVSKMVASFITYPHEVRPVSGCILETPLTNYATYFRWYEPDYKAKLNLRVINRSVIA